MYINHATHFSPEIALLGSVFESTHSAKRLANPHRAIILAAGRGTRMGDLTSDQPKSLIQVNDKPLIEHTLDLMDAAGVDRYVLNTHYLTDQMQDFARERQFSVWKAQHSTLLTVEQSEIRNPFKSSFWRTFNTVTHNPFFIANGDTILLPKNVGDVNPISKLKLEWARSQADITMLVVHKDNAVGLDKPADYKFENGNLVWCDPKDNDADHVYTGIAIATPRFIGRLIMAKFMSKAGKQITDSASRVDSDTMHHYLGTMAHPKTKLLQSFRAVVHDGLFLDVASPDMIASAEKAMTTLTKNAMTQALS
jgi:MurNAc alpha-1-phosphate uridylyltransferase